MPPPLCSCLGTIPAPHHEFAHHDTILQLIKNIINHSSQILQTKQSPFRVKKQILTIGHFSRHINYISNIQIQLIRLLSLVRVQDRHLWTVPLLVKRLIGILR